MKNCYFLFFSGLLLFVNLNVSAQQTYINKDWEHVEGIPGQYDYISSKLHPNGDFIYVGNNKTGGQSDILITCIDPNGSTVWQQTNSGSANQNDYGTDIAIDTSGNIYVCGAVSNGSNLDYRLIKYTSTGTLIWTKQYNGTGNGDDVPVAIRLDATGNVYITGNSTGLGTYTDYATLKYDQAGTLLWTKRYNYTNLPEVATSMEIDNNGNVFVAGASANNLNNSDFCIVKYNSAGTQVAVQRHATTGNGYDLPSEMAINSSGNIYLLGTSQSGSNKNIKLLALSNSLAIQWAKYIDQFGQDDEGFGLTLTPTNNILITGYSKKTNGGTNLVLAKYLPTGTQVWLKNKAALIDNQIAKGRKVRTNSAGKIYISGEAEINGTRNFVTQSYDDNGNLLFEKTSDNINSSEKAAQLIVANNDVFVTGTTNDGSTTKFATLKYSIKDKPFSIAGSGDTLWNAHELIIRFDTSAIIRPIIDKVGYDAGLLYEFVKPQVIEQMTNKTKFEWSKLLTFKIFRNMTIADSLSITRLDDTIRMPDFWATLSVIIPDIYNEQSIADSLNTLYSIIQYSEKNYLSRRTDDIPNDTYINTQQESLIPTTTYPNASINMESAWDIENGFSFTKVGVLDYPIYWAHEDFGDGTFSGSKIKGGWDYETQSHISNVTNPANSHGTACAGIIGAIRNNGKGIAGIAGGDGVNPSSGVQLYSFGIYKSNGDYVGDASVSEAIVSGAAWNPTTGYGYGLHVQNYSSGGSVNSEILEKAVESCWRNNCTFVASRGNNGNSNLDYPACFFDNMVLNTGASGTNGSYLTTSNGDVLNTSYGGNVDFIAPGTIHIVSSTINPSAPFTSWTNELNDPLYSTFRGTSAAAPHVSGVAALMFTHHNTAWNIPQMYPNNLAPEDIEFILQKYAKRCIGCGYSDYNGWGLIDAGAALQKVSLPAYKVVHRNSDQTTPTQSVSTNIQVVVTTGDFGIAPGYYFADRYQKTWSFVDVFGLGDEIVDIWSRNNASTGISAANPISGEPFISLNSTINQNTANITATTYCWHININLAGQTINKWIPAPPSNLKVAYSLHVRNTFVGVEDDEFSSSLKIFPNPANEKLFVNLKAENSPEATIEIYDITGKLLLKNTSDILSSNENVIEVDINNLQTGLYLCKVTTDKNILSKCFIKQ